MNNILKYNYYLDDLNLWIFLKLILIYDIIN